MLNTSSCARRVFLAANSRLVRSIPSKRLFSNISYSSGSIRLNNTTALKPRVFPVYSFIRSYASYPDHEELNMPALSPSMERGNLVKWLKKEGDQIKAGDAVADIETDKSTMAFEATDDSYLAKILIPEGTKDIEINKPIAILVSNKADVAKFKDFKLGGAKSETKSEESAPKPAQAAPQASEPKKEAPKKEAPKKAAPKPKAAAKSYPPHNVCTLPALSPSMETGNIASWRKKVGDKVSGGDIIAEIETDKSTMEFEYTEDGYLAKILHDAGSKNIPINTPIAIFANNKEDVEKFKDYTAEQKEEASEEAEAEAEPEQTETKETESQPTQTQQPKTSGGKVLASPLAKATAREKGIDLSQVSGTGPDGRIIKADVLEFTGRPAPTATAEAPQEKQATKEEKPTKAAPAPAAGDNYTDIPVTQIRKVTAERLLHSKKTIPHYYLTMEMKVDQLMKLRSEFNTIGNGKFKLSVNDFIVKAAALAMRKVPIVNSSWNDTFIRKYTNVDINIAVNTDQGLFTPIIKDADKKGLSEIANATKTLAAKAKENKLQPSEFQGGTFTISNLGMFGIKNFSAVINPPQAAILAVGGAEKILVPKEGAEGGVESATVLTVTLSCDHRVIDGAIGAEWLQAFKELMENPIKMML